MNQSLPKTRIRTLGVAVFFGLSVLGAAPVYAEPAARNPSHSAEEKFRQIHSSKDFYSVLDDLSTQSKKVSEKNQDIHSKQVLPNQSYSKLQVTADKYRELRQEISLSSIEGGWGSGDGYFEVGMDHFALFDLYEYSRNRNKQWSLPSYCRVEGSESFNEKDRIQLEKIGFVIKKAKDLPAYQLALARMKEWQTKYRYPIPLLDALKASVENTQMVFVDSLKMVPPPDQNLDIFKYKENTFTIASYIRPFGAFTSQPIWEKLDVCSQAGLLIHETFRQIALEKLMLVELQDDMSTTAKPTQIGSLQEKKKRFAVAEATVRKVTAEIMIGEPNGVTLVQTELMGSAEWKQKIRELQSDVIVLDWLQSTASQLFPFLGPQEPLRNVITELVKTKPTTENFFSEDNLERLNQVAGSWEQYLGRPGLCVEAQMRRSKQVEWLCLMGKQFTALSKVIINRRYLNSLIDSVSSITSTFQNIDPTLRHLPLRDLQMAARFPRSEISPELFQFYESLVKLHASMKQNLPGSFPVYMLLFQTAQAPKK